jgi:vacuolar-type H+-ATPase subunit D/Vma8
MALTNMKLRLKGAETGHSLLAKKRDALATRFRAILKKVDEVRIAYSHRCCMSDIGLSRPSERWEE